MACVAFIVLICVCIYAYMRIQRKNKKAITCKNMNKFSNDIIIQEIDNKIKNRAKYCDSFYEKYSIIIEKPEECIIEHFRKRGFTVTEIEGCVNKITISWKNVK